MARRISFECVVDDRSLNDRFSALVEVSKKIVIEASRDPGEIEIAHIFITPISGQPVEQVVHHHFVMYDMTGRGKYIVRTPYKKTVDVRRCSIWDLGHSFAMQVLTALTAFRS